MRKITVKTIAAGTDCENVSESHGNCIDCPHFCGIISSLTKDCYLVQCGFDHDKNRNKKGGIQ